MPTRGRSRSTPNNVAALFNLALLLARRHECHAPAALLLVRAQKALEDRHRPARKAQEAIVESHLQDPTWYRDSATRWRSSDLQICGADSETGGSRGTTSGVAGGIVARRVASKEGVWEDEL